MKYFLLIVIILAANGLIAGQSAKQTGAFEQQIRKLEQKQVAALLRNDIAEMEKNWAKNYTVNNPLNQVVKASQGRIHAGTRTYSVFVQEIEKVLVYGKTVIVMGRETVIPTGASPDAGQTIHRRFTKIWMMEK